MKDLRVVVPGVITFCYFMYLIASLCRSNWKRRRTLQEQQRVRQRVFARLERRRQEQRERVERERRETLNQEREVLERKREIDKSLRMEQIINALHFEVLPDEENRADANSDNNKGTHDAIEVQKESGEEASEVRNSLATTIVSSERKGNKPECVICLESYKPGQVLCSAKTNRCHHIFHEECAIAWLQESNECPLCRVNLLETAELSV